MGKGKQSETQNAREHVSRPLAALKDPTSFGPPPKNVNYHGGAALPNEITPHREGLGAPLTEEQVYGVSQAAETPVEEQQPSKPTPPALPYRTDRTGLRTDNLPPPPIHRDIQQSPGLPSRTQTPPTSTQPRLPPRLPARQNTTSPPVVETQPPSYDVAAAKPATDPYLNQSAVDRLGRAGISVPGLGIRSNEEQNPWKNERTPSQTAGTNRLSELHSHFARMKAPSQDGAVVATPTPTTQVPSPSPPPTSMPSWKQSQSAFQTAQNLRANPQSVTIADAQSAAQTAGQAQRSANVFREKHADSIANAQAKAKAWDQRYKVTSKINKFLDEHSDGDSNQQQQQQQQASQSGQQYQQTPVVPPYSPAPQVPQYPTAVPQPTVLPAATELSASIARKPPPPPAPRKPAHMQAPPPVPMGTKPSFG